MIYTYIYIVESLGDDSIWNMYPICSMVLKYLPTFAPEMAQFFAFKYFSTMERLGMVQSEPKKVANWLVNRLYICGHMIEIYWGWFIE